ncbi:hypothetical protein [Candidatus Methylocalor cossyra]|uniref:Uncharacterized protein n=1 Tax=Candidatus Methylocalor cossyra TaxID=3108543 RepID=A0ABM9NE65_9GAMM
MNESNVRYQSTDEGKKRYPPFGIYKGPFWDEPHLWKVCTCKPECLDVCKGYCGCEACWESYRDSLTVA